MKTSAVIKILNSLLKESYLSSNDEESHPDDYYHTGELYSAIRIIEDRLAKPINQVNHIEVVLWKSANKVLAVKSYKMRTGHTLKYSKDTVYKFCEALDMLKEQECSY